MTPHTAALLVVFGTATLTIGTGAQAVTNLTDFKGYVKAATEQVLTAAGEGSKTTKTLVRNPILAIILSVAPGIQIVFAAVSFFALRRNLATLRSTNADDATQIVKLLLAAISWSIIMIGSALTLAATIGQLRLTPG
jgi:hypothetical protein